jgi:BMFP domain-containing protein YqiC
MTERPKFFDDLAGVAGGAFSALAGIREEAESMVRARVEEAIRKLDLVRREDLDAVQEMAANARAGQETAEARLAALEARLSALEGAGPGGAAKRQPAADPSEGGASEVAPGTMPPGSKAPGSAMPPPSPDGVA